ncbi:DUF4387 domain-containing protein [Dictyoglomus thermophilum]|uniref:DUF4387 domain-containing protein n=2 Tax=Dictyoglomus thermophilum TaxID=14 RepID=B5YEU8_DICT6|nr:DUF4387 domain-containing protein [Dictyoglomus thermophilum]ACI19806.1 conserved hypothetical protein [Dictyoglomus thermophilum H-6-12]MCX7719688.1 DUF4387 domain-containing protein [Dictyoglomus thermophilum]TYT21123.1 DUF4387 domain-containing protein [Dictyoglomus thermophilum]
MRYKLMDLAKVIRTKNSGPFILTIDIIFKDPHIYHKLKELDYFSKKWWAEIYGIDIEDVISVIYFDPVNAVKANIKRKVPSGSPGDTDVYGAQQHAPLLGVELDV